MTRRSRRRKQLRCDDMPAFRSCAWRRSTERNCRKQSHSTRTVQTAATQRSMCGGINTCATTSRLCRSARRRRLRRRRRCSSASVVPTASASANYRRRNKSTTREMYASGIARRSSPPLRSRSCSERRPILTRVVRARRHCRQTERPTNLFHTNPRLPHLFSYRVCLALTPLPPMCLQPLLVLFASSSSAPA